MSENGDPYTYWRVGDTFVKSIGVGAIEDAVELTAGEYATALGDAEQQTSDRQAAAAAEAAAAAAAQGRADYDALTAIGVANATASRLTGYTPPQEA